MENSGKGGLIVNEKLYLKGFVTYSCPCRCFGLYPGGYNPRGMVGKKSNSCAKVRWFGNSYTWWHWVIWGHKVCVMYYNLASQMLTFHWPLRSYVIRSIILDNKHQLVQMGGSWLFSTHCWFSSDSEKRVWIYWTCNPTGLHMCSP